ncbi:membrane-anchored ubiquitin-fold protein 2 [Impatiens glandulifera]|uniref:membrane-anchored ubiquitin-fold protein 2 n=1 Tax=Impatiens glandulifera TaxID=253017 RepID=UPI001FB18740|nr:membrane-anchored ubiquitin-fold protein 2 [Impatiens glandulifera]
MSAVEDQLEIKFRLTDGSDIGPKTFPPATTIAALKQTILSQWPKEKSNGPRNARDVKLISAGRILENNTTLGDCRSPLCDIPGAVRTMHVVVQQPPLPPPDKEKKKAVDNNGSSNNGCGCVIL